MADQNQPAQNQQIQIKITDEILKGVYSNMAQISHTQEEFMLDFMNVILSQGQGLVASRVIVSPQHMKRILGALQENVKRYEDQFGVIPSTVDPEHKIGFKTE